MSAGIKDPLPVFDRTVRAETSSASVEEYQESGDVSKSNDGSNAYVAMSRKLRSFIPNGVEIWRATVDEVGTTRSPFHYDRCAYDAAFGPRLRNDLRRRRSDFP